MDRWEIRDILVVIDGCYWIFDPALAGEDYAMQTVPTSAARMVKVDAKLGNSLISFSPQLVPQHAG